MTTYETRRGREEIGTPTLSLQNRSKKGIHMAHQLDDANEFH